MPKRLCLFLLLAACACSARTMPAPAAPGLPLILARATQLVVVTTPAWDSTSGSLSRFERPTPASDWQPLGRRVPIVVGRTGLAWGRDFDALAADGAPRKREGDGRSPAGVFMLDTAFGFASPDSARWIRLPYVQLAPTTDCVDDTTSAHYNTVVDRARVSPVDWASAEHMRQISVYRMGVIVGYNADPPTKGRGSCIFLHIWSGPRSSTAGCTALDAGELQQVMTWLDRARSPVIMQVPSAEYERLRRIWQLPLLSL